MPDRPRPSKDAAQDGRCSLPTRHPGERVTLEEIREVLADQGYSADRRKAWLKEVLTDLTAESATPPSKDKTKLIEEIKAVIDQHQDGRPMSDDVL